MAIFAIAWHSLILPSAEASAMFVGGKHEALIRDVRQQKRLKLAFRHGTVLWLLELKGVGGRMRSLWPATR